MKENSPPLLDVCDLSVSYPVRSGVLGRVSSHVHAVRHADLSLHQGEILAVVGESGCGKSTLANALIGLRSWSTGHMTLDGQKVQVHQTRAWKKVRQQIQMVFQDPYGALNMRQSLREILQGPLLAHGVSRSEMHQRIQTVLDQVGFSANDLDKFPHAFSGGQRQRIVIARALTLQPRILVCDEPTSALDVSVQAQILRLLQELRQELGLAMVFITHDLSVVKALCDRVAVMYLGQMVETASTADLFAQPCHPYTQALLDSVPSLGSRREIPMLEGEVPSLAALPSGCSFANRCMHVQADCVKKEPQMRLIGNDQVRCFYPMIRVC